MFQGMILTVLHSLHNHRVFMDQLWQTHLRQGRPLNPVAAASQKSLSLHSPPVHHLIFYLTQVFGRRDVDLPASRHRLAPLAQPVTRTQDRHWRILSLFFLLQTMRSKC